MVLTLLVVAGIDVDVASADIYSNGIVGGDGTNGITGVGGAGPITATVGDANIVTGLGADVDDGSVDMIPGGVGAGVADMITGVGGDGSGGGSEGILLFTEPGALPSWLKQCHGQ